MRYIIIGCGITGVTIGRILAENGFEVEIWDRRDHIAGNMYDYVDSHGILVHKYGPHTFHTNNENVWKFVNQFEKWQPFKLVCGAIWDGKYTPTAFNFKTIDVFFPSEEGRLLKEKLLKAYKKQKSASVVDLLQNKDVDIRNFALFLFENDYAPYTAKQWGVSPDQIDPSVLKRVPIRFSYDESYFTDKYEAMPVHSYTRMFENMLNHPNIRVRLEVDAKSLLAVGTDLVRIKNSTDEVKVVFTGALDDLFDFRYGELPYRSLRFEWRFENKDSFQDAPVVAYPKAIGFTRITEYKKLPLQFVEGTSYAIEYPVPYRADNSSEPYYPVLTEPGVALFNKYRKMASRIKNMTLCGRLADFKYYNMDQAIEAAISTAGKLLSEYK